MKFFAFTIDLEPDYGGLVDHYEIFKDLNKVEEFLFTLNSFGVKVTVFSVGEIFELFPDVIKIFKRYDCEFEVHSYSHNFNSPDSDSEIKKARTAFFNYFQTSPKGYRAPRGKISAPGIKCLEKYGFLYDSSIIPSYFPNPFKYLFSSREIRYYDNSKIMEIPFTSLSSFRLTLSISYIKLLGLNFYKKLALPDVVCFGSHLHDFIINENSFNKLPLIWKLIYSRNKHRGIDFCVEFLEHIRQKGYKFCYMSDIYNSHKKTDSL